MRSCRRSACAASRPASRPVRAAAATTSTTFQELAERVQGYIRDRMPVWKTRYAGVESLTLAVMGCVVNGPGRVEGRQHRHQPAGDRRSTELSRLRRRRAPRDVPRHLRRALRRVQAAHRRLRRSGSGDGRCDGPATRDERRIGRSASGGPAGEAGTTTVVVAFDAVHLVIRHSLVVRHWSYGRLVAGRGSWPTAAASRPRPTRHPRSRPGARIRSRARRRARWRPLD